MNCHICKKKTVSFYLERTNITYYHCLSCELFFKSDELYQDFNTQKERYNLHDNTESNTGYRAYFQRFLDFTLHYVKHANNALDFGCGRSTILSSMLENSGIACDYYDPIYYPDTLEDEKKYHLIVSTEVFEHLHEPKIVFKSLINRLEKGGYLAIQTQFHTNDSERFKKWYYHQDPTHIVFFTSKSFHILSNYYDCKVVADNGKNMILIQKIN